VQGALAKEKQGHVVNRNPSRARLGNEQRELGEKEAVARRSSAPRGIRAGATGKHQGDFPKKLLMSEIIYSISNNQFRILVDELMHLCNDQLNKLVSPEGL
jgi:hypothetical protein